jgi:hypothetical protein
MGQLLSSLLEIFYTKKLDIVVIGLENRYVFVIIIILVETMAHRNFSDPCTYCILFYL